MGKEKQYDRRSGNKGIYEAGLRELQGKMYVYGVPGQKEKFINTTRAIADYVGTVYGKEMWKLVQEKEETEHDEPDDPGEDATKGEIERYKMLLKMSLDDERLYLQNKSKVFRIIVGQCVSVLRNKIESLDGYAVLVEEDDVVGLLVKLRELIYSTENVQYEYWTMQASLKNLLNMSQQGKESLAGYSKRFMAQLEVTEEVWGPLRPETNTGDSEESRNKFLACVFLAGVDRTKYKEVLDDLSNDYVLGTVSYPEDVAGMMTLLSNRRGGGASDKRLDAIRDGAPEVSFSQYTVTCYKCGKTGHTRKNCKSKKKREEESESEAETSGSDDERSNYSSRSRRSQRSASQRNRNASAGWSA